MSGTIPRDNSAGRLRAKNQRRATGRYLRLACCLLAGCSNVNPYYDASKPHHTPAGFRNVDADAQMPKPLREFLRWRNERPSEIAPPAMDLSVVPPDLDAIRANSDRTEGLSVTWIGHATVLVQLNGINILTDPHFSERASPVQWAGPKRWQPPALTVAELPRIDVVVVSHNHYDHLDLASVLALNAQPGGPPLFVVPLGTERWMADVGITRVKALDWWDSVGVAVEGRHPASVLAGTERSASYSGSDSARRLASHSAASAAGRPAGVREATVHLVPVQHWTRRTLGDANVCLWGGFVIEAGSGSSRRSVFFGGDTGYSREHFTSIGARLGPLSLALIPIGAYEPRWFMAQQHVNPDEAVRVHRDLRARRSLGVHWGTFQLTDEPLDQPLRELAAARAKHGVADSEFVTIRHGQSLTID